MNIEKEAIIEKNLILEKINSAILSTVDLKGNPNASYAPIALDSENNIYVYLSDLSKHTKNLINTRKVSVMLIEDESKAINIFARKRLTINANVELIERGTIDWYEKITFLDNRFGESMKYLKEMMDFNLFQLTPKEALLVYGFGKAFQFYGNQLQNFKHLNEKNHKMKLKNKTNNN